MQNLRRYQQAWWTAVLLAGAVCVGPFASGARAQVGTTMTEHGFCVSTTCSDNGTITPSTNPLATFGFTRSPDSNNGLQGTVSFDLVALVPTFDTQKPIVETGTNVGVSGSQTLALQPGTFTSANGTLDSFLGLTCVSGGCGPANPFSGFLAGETNQGVTGVTAFDVYLFDYGTVTFGPSTNPTFTASGSFAGGSFPQGTELYSYIDEVAGTGNCPAATNCRQDGTALSSTIIVLSTPIIVPDGGMTLMLLGGALVGLAGLRQRFRA